MNRMIRNSSNEDATRVLGWVGGDRLLEWLQSDRFRLYDAHSSGGLWVGKGYGAEPAFRRDPVRNLSHGATAFQVARLYTMLAGGTLFTPRLNDLMMDILSKPGIHHKFVRALEGVPGRAHLPQVGHLEGLSRRQRARRAGRPPLRDGGDRRGCRTAATGSCGWASACTRSR